MRFVCVLYQYDTSPNLDLFILSRQFVFLSCYLCLVSMSMPLPVCYDYYAWS